MGKFQGPGSKFRILGKLRSQVMPNHMPSCINDIKKNRQITNEQFLTVMQRTDNLVDYNIYCIRTVYSCML